MSSLLAVENSSARIREEGSSAFMIDNLETRRVSYVSSNVKHQRHLIELK